MKRNYENRIGINIKYVCNLNPIFFFKPQHLSKKIEKSENNRINCKNFIIFLILIKYVFKNSNLRVFIKPNKSSLQNILRAPYKNKMSRHQITIKRFFMNVSLDFLLPRKIQFNSLSSFFFFKKTLTSYYSFFESNLVFQHKSCLIFYFYLGDFFLV